MSCAGASLDRILLSAAWKYTFPLLSSSEDLSSSSFLSQRDKIRYSFTRDGQQSLSLSHTHTHTHTYTERKLISLTIHFSSLHCFQIKVKNMFPHLSKLITHLLSIFQRVRCFLWSCLFQESRGPSEPSSPFTKLELGRRVYVRVESRLPTCRGRSDDVTRGYLMRWTWQVLLNHVPSHCIFLLLYIQFSICSVNLLYKIFAVESAVSDIKTSNAVMLMINMINMT